MTPSQSELSDVYELLVSLFSSAELRQVVRTLPRGEKLAASLPGEQAPLSRIAWAAVELFQRTGLLRDELLWARLEHERPTRKLEIRSVSSRCARIVGRALPPSLSELRAVANSGGAAKKNPLVFLSSVAADRQYADRLSCELPAHGFPLWRPESWADDPEAAASQILEAIAATPYFVVLLSSESCRSAWTSREVFTAVLSQVEVIAVFLERNLTLGTLDYPLSLARRFDAFEHQGDWFSPFLDVLACCTRDNGYVNSNFLQTQPDVLVETLAREWGESLEMLCSAVGIPHKPPSEVTGRAAIHWFLLQVVETKSEAQLRLLATMVTKGCSRSERDALIETLRTVVEDIRDDVWPLGVERVCMALSYGGGETALHIKVGRTGSSESGGEGCLRLKVGTAQANLAGVEVEAELDLRRKAVVVSLRGTTHSMLVGAGARLWNGLRSVRRTLVPLRGDQLGAEGPGYVLFEQEIELGNEGTNSHDRRI